MNSQAARDQILVIWNRKAGNSAQREQVDEKLQWLGERGWQVEQREPESSKEVAELAAAAPENSLVVAAGGDGTVHAVAQGLIERAERTEEDQAEGQVEFGRDEDQTGPQRGSVAPVGPALGIIPMGTANDFVRSLGIPLDPLEAVAALDQPRFRAVDAVRVAVGEQRQWMINAAAGGNAAEVVQRMDADEKRRWGPWCYLRGVVDVAAELKHYQLRVWMDDGPPEDFNVFNVILANGRTAATLEVAPRATLEDGRLEVILIREGPLVQTIGVAAEFFAGDYLQNEQVLYRQAANVRIYSDDEFGISIDGELHWGRSFEFAVRPAAFLAVVGPEYRADPPAAP